MLRLGVAGEDGACVIRREQRSRRRQVIRVAVWLARGGNRDVVIDELSRDLPPALLVKVEDDHQLATVRVVDEAELVDIRRHRDGSRDSRLVVICQTGDAAVGQLLREGALPADVAGLVLMDDPSGSVRLAVEAAHQDAVWVSRRLWCQALAGWLKASPGSRFDHLTPAELDTLRLVAEGLTDTQIATVRTVSLATVRHHMRNLRHKTGCANRGRLIALAHRNGLAHPDSPSTSDATPYTGDRHY